MRVEDRVNFWPFDGWMVPPANRRLLRFTPEGETAVRAAWILGERRESEAVPDLIRAVETAADSFVIESAIEALGKIADARATACLEAAAKQGTVRVRIAALNALRRLARSD